MKSILKIKIITICFLLLSFHYSNGQEKWKKKAEVFNENTIAMLKKKARFALNCEDSLKATILQTEAEHYTEQGVKLRGGIKVYNEIAARTIGIEGCNGKIIYEYPSAELGWVPVTTTNLKK
jgi:hypothetical protein